MCLLSQIQKIIEILDSFRKREEKNNSNENNNDKNHLQLFDLCFDFNGFSFKCVYWRTDLNWCISVYNKLISKWYGWLVLDNKYSKYKLCILKWHTKHTKSIISECVRWLSHSSSFQMMAFDFHLNSAFWCCAAIGALVFCFHLFILIFFNIDAQKVAVIVSTWYNQPWCVKCWMHAIFNRGKPTEKNHSLTSSTSFAGGAYDFLGTFGADSGCKIFTKLFKSCCGFSILHWFVKLS